MKTFSIQVDLLTPKSTDGLKSDRKTFRIDRSSNNIQNNQVQQEAAHAENASTGKQLRNDPSDLPSAPISVKHETSSQKGNIDAQLDENNNELAEQGQSIRHKLSDEFQQPLDSYLPSSNSGASLLLPDYAPPSTPYQAKPSNATTLPNKSFTLKKM